jgi:S1-C subfamily serine protease
MTNLLDSLSSELAAATDTASKSVVQVQAGRRAVTGVVFDADHILTLGRMLHDDVTAVRRADGHTLEGRVLGRHAASGLAVVRATDLGVPAAATADEPRPGHLTLAVGRTWSGGVFSALAPVAVVGGPLRTGRTTEIARVVRVGLAPHGALAGGALVNGAGRVLGVMTAAAIRGTTVVIPAALAWAAAREVVAEGGARQAFIGVRSTPVTLSAHQRAEDRERGLLVMSIVPDGPADAAGVLVGDVIVEFGGARVAEIDDLLTLLRATPVGQAVALSIVRGRNVEGLTVTVAERRPSP